MPERPVDVTQDELKEVVSKEDMLFMKRMGVAKNLAREIIKVFSNDHGGDPRKILDEVEWISGFATNMIDKQFGGIRGQDGSDEEL